MTSNSFNLVVFRFHMVGLFVVIVGVVLFWVGWIGNFIGMVFLSGIRRLVSTWLIGVERGFIILFTAA